MKSRVIYRRNAADDPVHPGEAAIVAKDMIKLGDFDGADKILRWEGGMGDEQFSNGTVARVYFAAVVEELASGNRAAARKLFTKVRKRYRREQLPRRLFGMTTFTERNVEMDMAVALNAQEHELWIRRSDNDGVFSVGFGRQEYAVVKNDDAAEEIAVEQVACNMRDEPDVYLYGGFMLAYIDKDQLREKVRELALDNNYWNDARERDVLSAADQFGIEYEEDEDGEVVGGNKRIDEIRDEVAEAQADDRATNPYDYLSEVMNEREIPAWLLANIDIDIEKAAADLVRNDGAGAYLSNHNGELYETISGFTYWQVG